MKKQALRETQGIGNPARHLAKRLYSLPEAATYLGRSVWSVRELIWKGELPKVQVGRRIHLDIHDLDAFIEKNKVRESY